jgi:putative spermidine/putrescine transport system permease protein
MTIAPAPAQTGVLGVVPRGSGPRVRGWRSFALGSGAPAILAVPVLFMVLALGVPLIFVLYTAFAGPGDSTFASVVQSPLFLAALGRTVLMAVLVTVLAVVLGVLYALAIMLSPRWLRTILMVSIGATFVISLMVRTYGWIILLQPRGIVYDVAASLGLANGPLEILQTAPAMYLGMVHVMLPYAILLTYTSLSALDANQLRASRSMGASAQLTFWRIIVPQISPGIVAGGILVFMISLGFYITPAFLGGPTQLTMGTLIGREMSGTFDFKAAAIMGTLLFVAVTALYLVAEKVFRVTEQWDRA